MTKRKKGQVPPGFLALIESARRDEAGGSAPRKHHLVPASYLRRWEEDGKIRVTHVDQKKSHLSAPEKAARETDYYRLESPDLDESALPPLLFEKMLGEVEGMSVGVIDALAEHGPDVLTPKQRAEFSLFLAFQITRGHSFRTANRLMVGDFFKMQYEGVTREGVRQLLIERGMPATETDIEAAQAALREVTEGDLVMQPQDAAIVAESGSVAIQLGEHLFARDWHTFETLRLLVTCDEPVVLLGGPPRRRDERAGVSTAAVAMFPLGPSKLLVMFHPRMRPRGSLRLDAVETAEINREIMSATSRWAFEQPSRHVTERMPVPPPAPPFKREGPFPMAGDGRKQLFRTFHPTRWANTVPPPWPVSRWW
ncbi:DUF4238 domain-containing protein [Streptomyces antibioticus]|uniref:DUF4238 domain-containing protein n=1 Tax=Streptomyces antibioticus TaxID=1890 RepID=UPI002257B3F0|nr:DUF4238 domain-containing protein [Streptomyces antibioticus]MCX5169056.1 DUF4238 domain-containing protein [Streptomyces antibioticus]